MTTHTDLISAAEIIAEDYMEPLGLSGAALAKQIGVSASTVNRMLKGNSQLTAEMAVKICAAVGGSPAVLMRIESEYRLALAEAEVDISKIKRIEADTQALIIA